MAATGGRFLEDPIALHDEEVLDERPGEVRVIEGDAPEGGGELRLEAVKLRAQRLGDPELERNVGLGKR